MDGPSKEPLVIYDFNPYNLPREYLRAIGLVVAAASQTESIMQQLIGALLNTDLAETYALAAHMTVPLKDHIIRALAELNAPSIKEIDAIDDLLDAARDAIDRRNTLAHNALAIHPDTGEVLSHRLTARGSLQVVLTPISAEEIEKDALLIYEAGMDLMMFMISRGIAPRDRIRPVYRPSSRSKKARASRRNRRG